MPGLRAEVSAPRGTAPDVTRAVPTPGAVVAWTLAAYRDTPGGAVIEPVFLAGGRAWTVRQFRERLGQMLDVTVTAR